MGLFTATFDQPAVNVLPRAEWHSLLAPITPAFLSKLGDGNARVREASEAALLMTCRLAQLGPHHVTAALIAPQDSKKQADARLQIGRLTLLSALLREFGEQLRDLARYARARSYRVPLPPFGCAVRARRGAWAGPTVRPAPRYPSPRT